MEQKFMDFSLHGSECFRERKFHGNESVDFSLPETKVKRNEKSRYQ